MLDRHQEAIEFDLISLGVRLSDLGGVLSWRDLYVVVRNLPMSSALARSMSGAEAQWGVTEYLLAQVVDALNGANWQRGGGKGQKPKPTPRPGAKAKVLGSKPIPMSEFDQWWDDQN